MSATHDTQEDREDFEDADTAAAGEGSPGGGDELAALRKERDELFDRLARATAEFQNSRKRLEADSENRQQIAKASLIKTLLPIVDNLERALGQDPSKVDPASVIAGIKLVSDQFAGLLKAADVETISPAPGAAFEPAKHEALLQQESDQPAGTVTMVLQKGYAMHGRTLRAAQVALSKAK